MFYFFFFPQNVFFLLKQNVFNHSREGWYFVFFVVNYIVLSNVLRVYFTKLHLWESTWSKICLVTLLSRYVIDPFSSSSPR